jgi:hypothetical protein
MNGNIQKLKFKINGYLEVLKYNIGVETVKEQEWLQEFDIKDELLNLEYL